ncbi:triphosphoribosyl-dephospho-CoA synthase [Acinetobacter qingfengensis]|uniref:Probable 2-(5''-triphosphoribosyl)-3'-dephosphocoenzyme-A synthase n=1 Tax=Acinetobacter qingfengensis TaxID=1262585 RepID=A0A1E7R673_9GAMM|nr:triphosphoribosyl-dephospho-CoA synthase [Acinetobacter qingfengensis]KAA8734867.1 triphosphoribosyl-dephospho-CoA synthase [Acinetobacter qingfengensis]OEY94787.1 triphosphoribosyl-dephospho-CoA synthase MdcB [Acinetobacter qingfengensis]
MHAHLYKTSFNLAEYLADVAVQALLDEVNLSPKPALVDQRGCGAHDDLNLQLMEASAHSLSPMFKLMAEAGQEHGVICQALREHIGVLGRQGEQQMLNITQGINTHRGAIWSMGLMVTAASITYWQPEHLTVLGLCQTAGQIACLEDRFLPKATLSHGQKVREKFGVHGAKQHAQQGFPVITQYGFPQLLCSRQNGIPEKFAQLDALLSMMAHISDTCVIHRAGLSGLKCMQIGAQQVLDLGGSATFAGRQRLKQLETDLLVMRASAGGAADLLATLLFLDRVQQQKSIMKIRDKSNGNT